MRRIQIRGTQEHVVGAVDVAEMDEHRIAEAVETLGALGWSRRERHELVEVARRGRPVALRDVDVGELLDRVAV